MEMRIKYLAVLGGLFLAATANAAVISRTYSYSSGNTINATENNTNENTIYSEFNGNIESANLKDGTIVNADISDSTIDKAKFTTALQSTFTYIYQLGADRRPVLTYVSATTVDVENNTGTSNETCIFFPDQKRCVTENTGSTSVNRRLIITENCSLTGTNNSGLAPGEAEASNTWYAVYSVKSQSVSTDFVLCASTNTPVQANYSTLNTLFGTNGWLYLGLIKNGDWAAAQSDIVSFKQAGNKTWFLNDCPAANTGMSAFATECGVILSSVTANTFIKWTYASGFAAQQVPTNIAHASFQYGVLAAGAGAVHVGDASTAHMFRRYSGASLEQYGDIDTGISDGLYVTTSAAGTTKFYVSLRGYTDSVLGVGHNPQL